MHQRTQTENGNFESRCLFCFLTIAAGVETEAELDRLEARHICPERVLAELNAEKAATQAKPPAK